MGKQEALGMEKRSEHWFWAAALRAEPTVPLCGLGLAGGAAVGAL